MVADAIEARTGEPALAADAAERAALAELGDPAALAARYADRPLYLIGPTLFPEWKRLLTLLLPIVVPIVSLVVLAANLLSDAPVGQAIASALGTGFTVTTQMLFWFTLVFAIAERFGGQDALRGKTWTIDDLPQLPQSGRLGLFDAISTVAGHAFVILGILWVQLLPPFVIDGQSFPLFDPALWSFWLPYFLIVSLIEIGFTIALYRRGRWTWTFAAINAALGVAFAAPVLWLLQNELLLNPALVARVTDATGGTWLDVTGIVIGVTVVVVVATDAIDGFRKASASTRNTLGPSGVERT